jgi:hypothetical protein
MEGQDGGLFEGETRGWGVRYCPAPFFNRLLPFVRKCSRFWGPLLHMLHLLHFILP